MELQPPPICVSICEKSIKAVEEAIVRAQTAAAIIEVRLDCLDPSDFGESLRKLDDAFANSSTPTIVTYRPAEQGGHRILDARTRLMFWLFNRPANAAFLDMELDLVRNEQLFKFDKPLDWRRVICSRHELRGMPNLDQLYSSMATSPAGILKIAVQAEDVIDCLPVFKLLERARNEGRQMIAIAMGSAGLATRILGPSRGGYLTYASLDSDNATAPGQLTAQDLRDIYRIDKVTRQTEIFGLIGSPVSHSFSPRMHNAAFDAAGLDAVYIPFLVQDIAAFINRMVRPRTRELDWKVRGLSVTAPHKLAVMDHLDWIDPNAKEIGAVNTIVVEGDSLKGYNTDAEGFIGPLTERLGDLRGTRCAILGAGGAASSACWALRNKGAQLTVFARTRAASLEERFGVESGKLEEFNSGGFDVVVNTTPLGSAGEFENETPLTSAQLRGARLAYDLVYNPIETLFLREAREAGCDRLGGLPMLVAQAEAQFKLWTGVDAPRSVMIEALEK